MKRIYLLVVMLMVLAVMPCTKVFADEASLKEAQEQTLTWIKSNIDNNKIYGVSSSPDSDGFYSISKKTYGYGFGIEDCLERYNVCTPLGGSTDPQFRSSEITNIVKGESWTKPTCVFPVVYYQYNAVDKKYEKYLKIYVDGVMQANLIYGRKSLPFRSLQTEYVKLYRSAKSSTKKKLVGTFKANVLYTDGIEMSRYGLKVTDTIYVKPVDSELHIDYYTVSKHPDILANIIPEGRIRTGDKCVSGGAIILYGVNGTLSDGIKIMDCFSESNKNISDIAREDLIQHIGLLFGGNYWNSYGLSKKYNTSEVWNICSNVPSKNSKGVQDHCLYVPNTCAAKYFGYSSTQCFGFAEFLLKIATPEFEGSTSVMKVKDIKDVSRLDPYYHLRLPNKTHSVFVFEHERFPDGSYLIHYWECNGDYKTNKVNWGSYQFDSFKEYEQWLVKQGAYIIK